MWKGNFFLNSFSDHVTKKIPLLTPFIFIYRNKSLSDIFFLSLSSVPSVEMAAMSCFSDKSKGVTDGTGYIGLCLMLIDGVGSIFGYDTEIYLLTSLLLLCFCKKSWGKFVISSGIGNIEVSQMEAFFYMSDVFRLLQNRWDMCLQTIFGFLLRWCNGSGDRAYKRTI